MFYSKLLKIKNNIRLSQLSLIGGSLALLMLSPSAAAVDCIYENNFFNIKKEINLGPNQKILHEEVIADVEVKIFCNKNPNVDFKITSSINSIQNLSNVYPTNLDGIGIKYQIGDLNHNQCKKGTSGSINNMANTLNFYCRAITNKSQIDTRYDKIILVKLKDAHSVGKIRLYPNFQVTQSIAGSTTSRVTVPTQLSDVSNGLAIRRYGCTLGTPNLVIPIGQVKSNNFTGVRSTFGRKASILELTCYPGTHYFLRVDGVQEGNHPGVIKLTSEAGVATGVGVQLLANGQPVEFGKAKQMGTSDTSGNSFKETIDITAQYYQTENRVTPGPANASATFTMTYQ
ncbi:fimbrial protein [Yersinia massiliensis]|uniref:fimbrial protein n=1 Tax=Yersinia massiliensis TaxID=419257 RepID=UPI00031CAB71|nr:fimbrial protein [Yersinia massiliensis]